MAGARPAAVENLVLPVYVPITLHRAQARAQARGNLVAQMVVLPIGERNPGRRLAQITTETANQKARNHPGSASMTTMRSPG